MLVLSSTALLSGCDSKRNEPKAEPGAATALVSAQHAEGVHDGCAHPPGSARSAGPPAIALNPQIRADLTTISVSAHKGNVVIRKEGSDWVMRGRGGCTVAPSRVERALESLASVSAVATNEPVPAGTAFQLQISLLIGEQRVIHMEVADRNEQGDAVRLDNDAMVRMQGLDRALWSPHPVDWCRGP